MSPSAIIQIYAALHAFCAAVFCAISVPDEYILTLLTILMIAQICNSKKLSPAVMSCAIVFGNLVGYLLGTLLSFLLFKFGLPGIVVYPVSTFITTEAVGFSVAGLSRFFSPEQSHGRTAKVYTAVAIVGVYIARVILATCYRRGVFLRIDAVEEWLYFLISFCVMTLLTLAVMVGFEISSRRTVRKEQEKRHLAQYRYLRLSQQVNPHFLFNSLNVLDFLVRDGQNEKAGEYIGKLSGIYRYMLAHEEQVLVALEDEIDFTTKYIDLMKLRFAEGLEVRLDIDAEALRMKTVPCSVQLLIENALKHNAIDKAMPLVIRIRASAAEGRMYVSNNLCPKLTPVRSTGKGLKYITQQYRDVSGKDISVEKDAESFTVTLPLL